MDRYNYIPYKNMSVKKQIASEYSSKWKYPEEVKRVKKKEEESE